MNKEAFELGFVKAAMSAGVDITTAVTLAKQASNEWSYTTPPMMHNVSSEKQEIPMALLAALGAGGGAGLGALGGAWNERGKEKGNRHYLSGMFKGGLGGAALGAGAGAGLSALAHPQQQFVTDSSYSLPYPQ